MKIGKKLFRFILLSVSVILFLLLLNLLVYFEKAQEQSSIRSFSDALWYSVVTLTTVGYGDMYPISLYGRVIGYFFVICSLGFLGFLISKLTDAWINIREKRKMGLFGTKFSNHIIIIGWDDFSRAIADQLVYAGNRVAVVTNQKNDIDLLRDNFDEKQVFPFFTDYNNPDNLKKANIQDASGVFINLKTDTEKLVYILNLKKYYRNCKFLITLDNANLKDTFHSAGVDYVLSKNEVAAKLVASYIFEPDVARYSADLLSSSRNENDFDLQQYRVISKNPYLGINYGKAFYAIKQDYNSILIGLSKKKNNTYELLKNPPDETIIEKDDYLIVITNGRAEKLLQQAFGIQEGILTSWSG